MAKKKAPAKKTSAKKKAKASANGNGLKFLGELRSLLSRDKALLSITEKIEQGKATHTDLVKLRDGIREKAATLRAEEKADEAKALSDINRYVRRLERAAR